MDDAPYSFDSIYLLDSTATIIKMTTLTDIDGNFKFKDVSPGNYCIKDSGKHYGTIKVSADKTIKLKIITKFCPYDGSIKNKTCPICHKQNKVIPILYGLLISTNSDSPMKGAGETFIVGGCNVTDCDPNWYCKRDKNKF
jgi:hypothetical protein